MATSRSRTSLDTWLRAVDELLQAEEPVPDDEPEVEEGDAA